VLTLWKATTGGKTVGCLPATPVPELLHAAGLLPIALDSPRELSRFSGQLDAWLVEEGLPLFPDLPASIPHFAVPPVPPARLEDALERIEALAEWAESVSGSPASEGGLWKSIRSYAIRRSLLQAVCERSTREPEFLTPEERNDLVRAGIFLPPETHSRILSSILGVEPAHASVLPEGEKGDPLIVLAKRLM
jgi:hypothetical protein